MRSIQLRFAGEAEASTESGRGGSGRDWIRRLGQRAIDLVFPWRCVGCGVEGDAAICPGCLDRVRWIEEPFCERCGEPFASGPPRSCGRCLERPPSFARARAIAWYRARDEAGDPIGAAIRGLKYAGRRGLGAELGRLLADRQPWRPGEVDVVVPVPLHVRRLRERGYNQALLLARATAERLAAPLERRSLRRARETASQAGLGERERRANLVGAFILDRPGRFDGRRVLVVDDVLTTGATAELCARALLADGAASVEVLALARTVLR